MRAIGLHQSLPITNPESLQDLQLPKPSELGARDLLVHVHAVSVNPVDVKIRGGANPEVLPAPRILGWDASGVVTAVGPEVSHFKVGDEVFYAGDLTRPGTNSEFHQVDERIVGPKPTSMSHAQAAALPLTSITAYESLFHRLGIDHDGANKGQSILIIGGSGGVPSMAIQMAKSAGLTVIATGSRQASIDWVTDLGADHVVNHRQDMISQVRALGFEHTNYVAIFNDMSHWDEAAELVAPQGGIVCIDDTDLPMNMHSLKMKSASLHWELMFTRAMFQTPDMDAQHQLLTQVSEAVDAGSLRGTLARTLQPLNAATLRQAHELVETGSTTGKVVVAGPWKD